MLQVEASVSFHTYKDHGFPCILRTDFVLEDNSPKCVSASLVLTGDTGAQVNVLPLRDVQTLGMTKDSLLPATITLVGPYGEVLPLLGVAYLQVDAVTQTGTTVTVTDSFYIIEEGPALAIRILLTNLGCLPEDWPIVGQLITDRQLVEVHTVVPDLSSEPTHTPAVV